VIEAVLRVAYFASLRTEEGRFVRGCLTFADPLRSEADLPLCRRHSYPLFSAFDSPINLSAAAIVKLSRAIDQWSASIAVYGSSPATLIAWGVLDQMVAQNTWSVRESDGHFGDRGLFSVRMDGVGEVSVHHRSLFLGALRQDDLIDSEPDVLSSPFVQRRVERVYASYATAMARVLRSSQFLSEESPSRHEIAHALADGWSDAVARICIALRRLGTGGSLLITPSDDGTLLSVKHALRYRRLADALPLKVLTKHLQMDMER